MKTMSENTSVGQSPRPEEWRPIKGVDPFYEVSNKGRVRSLDHYGRRGLGGLRIFYGKELAHDLSVGGYPRVMLRKNGRGNKVFVHRLVVLAFLGEDRYRQVNHKDGNKQGI